MLKYVADRLSRRINFLIRYDGLYMQLPKSFILQIVFDEDKELFFGQYFQDFPKELDLSGMFFFTFLKCLVICLTHGFSIIGFYQPLTEVDLMNAK